MFGRCIGLARGEILDRIFLRLHRSVFYDDQFLNSEFGDHNPLYPDISDLLIDIMFDDVDALCRRTDTDLSTVVGQFTVALERVDPVVIVGFNMSNDPRVVGESRVKEVCVSVDTYLFIEFGDNFTYEIVLVVVVLIALVLIFVEAVFVVNVGNVYEACPKDSVAFSVIIEVTDAKDSP